MATELEITSWRNVLDLISQIKDILTEVNNLEQLQLALDAFKVVNEGNYNQAAFYANNESDLVGFGISKIGKKGNKIEWYELIRTKVLGGIEPPVFLTVAYEKSTGNKVKYKTNNNVGLNSGGNGIRRINGASDPRYVKGQIGTWTNIFVWAHDITSRLYFKPNDLTSLTEKLRIELTNIRVPMPDKFQAWITDLRDTQLSHYKELNDFRLWELTTQKGELVSDIAAISDFANNKVAEIERAVQVPAAPAPVVATAVSPVTEMTPTSVTTTVPEPTLPPSSVSTSSVTIPTTPKSKAGLLPIAAILTALLTGG